MSIILRTTTAGCFGLIGSLLAVQLFGMTFPVQLSLSLSLRHTINSKLPKWNFHDMISFMTWSKRDWWRKISHLQSQSCTTLTERGAVVWGLLLSNVICRSLHIHFILIFNHSGWVLVRELTPRGIRTISAPSTILHIVEGGRENGKDEKWKIITNEKIESQQNNVGTAEHPLSVKIYHTRELN